MQPPYRSVAAASEGVHYLDTFFGITFFHLLLCRYCQIAILVLVQQQRDDHFAMEFWSPPVAAAAAQKYQGRYLAKWTAF